MRNLLAVFACSAFLWGCSEAKPTAQVEKTPSGLSYVRVFVPGAKDVAIRAAWPTDWAFRADFNQAVPYIGADLILAGGAQGYPAGQAGEKIADLKAQAQVWVTPDYAFGGLTAPREHLDEAVAIARAHLQAPSLDQSWFERIQQGFASSLAEATAQPERKGADTVRWAILGDSSLRRYLSVDPSDQIMKASRAEVVLWHKETFVRDTAKIVIAGDIDVGKASHIVDALMAGLPKSEPRTTIPKPALNFAPRRILLHVPDARTSSLEMVAALPPTRGGFEYEDLLLADALGNGEQSVLFKSVRTRLRAAYAFGASIDGFTRENRFLEFSGEVETPKLANAEQTARDAYARFRTEGYTRDLASAKASYASVADSTLKDPAALAFSGLMGVLDGNPTDTAMRIRELLDTVSKSTIDTRLNSAFPKPDGFVTIAVSPDANALPNACVIERPEDVVHCR